LDWQVNRGITLIYLKIIIAAFLLLETANIAALYFFPDSKYANSIGVFKAWETSKGNPELHNLVKYLVNWVAGTKLIFILVIGVLLFTAEDNTLILAGVALVAAIGSFFWRLYPQIREMDAQGQIEPKNYSRVLRWMILAIIILMLAGILASIFI
jgi:hypothetical protein